MYQPQRMSAVAQFGVLIGLFLAGLIFGSIITLLIIKLVFGIPFMDMAEAILNPKNVQAARLLQSVSAFFMFAVPAFVFALIIDKKPFRYLKFSGGFSAKQLFLIILLLFASLFVGGALAELNQIIPISKDLTAYFKKIEDSYNAQVMAMAHMDSLGEYFLSLIVLALLPALFEEIFFRGALQQVLIHLTRNAFTGIFITSILFSAIHLSYFGFLPRLFLGMLLGYIFYYSKSIWLNIATHFLNNAFVVTEMYVLSRSGKLTAEALDETFPLYFGLLSIIAVLALFVVFRKESERYLSAKAIVQQS